MIATSARCFVILLLTLSPASSEDWPQFLGPNRNGAVADDSFAQKWIEGDLHEEWRVPLGEGYSGIAAINGHCFTMDSRGRDEFVFALRSSDGKEMWRVRTGDSPGDVYGGLGPRVTPSVAGGTLFTTGAQGDLLALRVESGDVIWRRSLAKDMGWRSPAEGASCSPLVSDGRIYLIIGGGAGKAVAAFDQASGRTLWSSQEDRTSYSSPVRWKAAKDQILFLTGSQLTSLDPSSGKLLWKYPWPTYDFVNVATPLIVPPDRVFISSGYDQGAALLRIQPGKNDSLTVQEVWRNREMKNHFNNSVHYNGVFYGFDNSILKAIDAATGRTLWRESGLGKGSLILSGAYLLLLSERGELICAKPNSEKFDVRKRLSLLKGTCWTPPSLARGKLYLRNQKEVVCLSAK